MTPVREAPLLMSPDITGTWLDSENEDLELLTT